MQEEWPGDGYYSHAATAALLQGPFATASVSAMFFLHGLIGWRHSGALGLGLDATGEMRHRISN